MIPALRDLLDVLFASLWQDAIIGFCTAALLYVCARRLNAATRNLVLQTALVAMIVVPVVTTLPHLARGAVMESVHGGAVVGATSGGDSAGSALGVRRIDVALSDRVVVLVGAAWFAGALVFLLRILAGMAQLLRILRTSRRLAHRGGTQIYASAALRVPVAFGLLQPAIVVPADIVGAGGDELECVLLHELAHVRRHDAWLHTFERIFHALLFFNPAVTLLLQSAAFEREAACDDWAVAHSDDAPTYTRSLALLAVRTGGGGEMPAVCGAMGFGHAIINRIERLQDLRRNGSLLLSPYALGGFSFMLISIALTLRLIAPAVAFAPNMPVAQPTGGVSNCTRDAMVTYSAQPPAPLPDGRVVVRVTVSPTGTATAATITKSSGNATLDRVAVKIAKENGYAPAMRNCKPVAGTYLFMLNTVGVK